MMIALLLGIGCMVGLFTYLFGPAGPFILVALIVGYFVYLAPGMKDGNRARAFADAQSAPVPWIHERHRDYKSRQDYLGKRYGQAARRSANIYWSRKLHLK